MNGFFQYDARIVLAVLLVFTTGELTLGSQDGPPSADSPPPSHTADTLVDTDEAAETFVIVEGQITDSLGTGHEGVTVTVRRMSEDGSAGEIIGTATTDVLGDFVVRSSKPSRGRIVVTFSKPRYTKLTRELRIGDDEFPPFLAEILEGNLVVVGHVVNALTEKPIPDASVSLSATEQDWYAKSDDLGRFTIKGLPPGMGELVVKAKGYGRERQPVAQLEDFGEIIVHLKPERIVHLNVVGDLGKPIAGVTVECYDEPRDDFRTTVTDKNGSITIRGLHFDADSLSLRLTHEEHVSSEGFDREIIVPTNETESTHKLVMARAGRITGLVTETKTVTPLNGARVMTGSEYSDTSPRDWADYQGKYTIQGVKPGLTVVTVHLSGYAPDLKTVEVTAGETTRGDFELSSGAMLVGSVKDEGGKPIADAYVEATQWRGRSTLGLRAITNRLGVFVISGAPHDEFEIAALARSYGEVKKTVKADTTKMVEITLPRASAADPPRHISILDVGDTVPEVTLTTLEGRTFKLADLKGKTVLLDFWAIWCAPCVEELPQLVAVHEKFGSRKDFVMIGISRDFEEAVLRDFLKKNGKLKWHHVFDGPAGVETVGERFGVTWIPRVFLIGPDGKIIATDLGGDRIIKRIEQVLKR